MARAIDPTVGDGLLIVDKPAGWTSHEVVGACRRICGTRKVGHAGTLDPMATGLLVVGVNRATRLLTYLVGCDKAYTATIRLGQATITDDAEGEVTTQAPADAVRALGTPEGAARVTAAVAALTGDITQVPSAVSAIKVDGKRSYARVRAGENVELAGRPVTVTRFDVLATAFSEADGGPVLDLDVEVEVSSGTYVRALARDLGAALGVGGHLTALRRTRVGGFTVGDAATVEQLETARAAGAPRPDPGSGETGEPGTSGLPLLTLSAAARVAMPARELDAEEARQVGHGVRIPSEQPGRVGPVAAFAPDGTLVAVLDESATRVMPETVFAPS
ncbi:MAG: tRNA pseudouridine(55) synthase TruB [Dermatophilus congolensis]|nr:tRNA pseudouridine(55) synthase TruB [Dermatophilus congolensis]